jgi:hypothetical protein
MPLNNFMTATASTLRHPAIVSGKRGDPVTHLEAVKITPVMLADTKGVERITKAAGLEGSAVQIFEAYTESHSHTDDSSPVTQLPDIIAGDQLVIGSITYAVRWAEQQPATTSFGATLIVFVTEDKRA